MKEYKVDISKYENAIYYDTMYRYYLRRARDRDKNYVARLAKLKLALAFKKTAEALR